MTIYKQGDVVLLPFPPTNQFASLVQVKPKNRPAVIISTDWFFYSRGDHVVVALTSQPKKDCFDIKIRDYEQDEGWNIKELDAAIKGEPVPSMSKVKKENEKLIEENNALKGKLKNQNEILEELDKVETGTTRAIAR
ncbi:MAG TPA: type II toxin-antitoxin system PemK/MazF family toxin [Bacillota bacterium]|nr:type II toxin-antitoxin system PemK/MazF family toxin [Bacillota bacterium]